MKSALNAETDYNRTKNLACEILRLRRVALATYFFFAAVRSYAERFYAMEHYGVISYNIKNQKNVIRELQVVFQIRGERLFLFLSRECSRIHWRRKPFQKEASYPDLQEKLQRRRPLLQGEWSFFF